jgi:hypothetical protein
MTDDEYKEFRKARQQEGLKFDPETAEVTGKYVEVLDPYGCDPNWTIEMSCIGWDHFVRAPGSDIWVWFGDLPEEVWEKIKKREEA